MSTEKTTIVARLRFAALAVTGCGVACSLAFFAFFTAFGPFRCGSFIADILPYILVGGVALLSRKPALAIVCLGASLPVVGFGIYRYLEGIGTARALLRGEVVVDDTELMTEAAKWDFALLTVIGAIVCCGIWRICHASHGR
jgi:hypothetical protein